MHRLRPLIILLAVLAFAGSAVAQSLTPQQRADVRKLRNLTLEVENRAERMAMAVAAWGRLGSRVGDDRVQNFNRDASAFAEAYQQAQPLAGTLPAGDDTVDDLVARLNASLAKYNQALAAAKAHLEGANAAVDAVGGREAIRKDIERISAIAYQFAAFDPIMQNEPERAATLLREFRPALQELATFEEKYAEFLKRDNADTAPVRRELASAKSRLAAVPTAATAYLPKLLAMAGRELDEAEQLADRALKEGRPRWFGPDGGITQQLNDAKARLRLAHLIDRNQAAAAIARARAVEAMITGAGRQLETEIVASNQPPADAYAGEDANLLKEQALAAWLEANPDDVVVATHIPTAQWTREKKWTWFRDAFYWSDRSDLQAAVIIKAKGRDGIDELHYWPVDITKDHTDGDKLRFTPWQKEPLDQMAVHMRFLPDKLD